MVLDYSPAGGVGLGRVTSGVVGSLVGSGVLGGRVGRVPPDGRVGRGDAGTSGGRVGRGPGWVGRGDPVGSMVRGGRVTPVGRDGRGVAIGSVVRGGRVGRGDPGALETGVVLSAMNDLVMEGAAEDAVLPIPDALEEEAGLVVVVWPGRVVDP